MGNGKSFEKNDAGTTRSLHGEKNVYLTYKINSNG